MQTTSAFKRSLLYDPNESCEEYYARRQHALDQGRQAVRDRQISGDLYLFFEYLIERVGGNKYTWIGEDTLAEVFQVDESTIKRWIGKLVRAGLIRRQRQFGTTSRTYITAYDLATTLLDCEDDDTSTDRAVEAASDSEHGEHGLGQDNLGTAPENISFRRTDAPTLGADLRRTNIKISHVTSGGGGQKDIFQNPVIAPEIHRLLEREGVAAFYLAPVLQQKPLDELRAVSRYLDHQHNIRDRARLFAALAAQGFGMLLLAGRAQQPQQAKQSVGRCTKAPPQRNDDHLKYVSGALAQYIQGGMPEVGSTALPPDPSPCTEVQPPSTSHAQIWQQVLDIVRATLPVREFETWFEETHLVLLDGDMAVIGTPNIFAREKLEMPAYAQRLTEALHRRLGQPLGIKIVIGR